MVLGLGGRAGERALGEGKRVGHQWQARAVRAQLRASAGATARCGRNTGARCGRGWTGAAHRRPTRAAWRRPARRLP
eukprot:4892269-Prymnesium_polylepis.1